MASATTTREQRMSLRQPLLALALVGSGMIAGLGVSRLPALSGGVTTTVDQPVIDVQTFPGYASFRTEETAGAAPARPTTGQIYADFRTEETAGAAAAHPTAAEVYTDFRSKETAGAAPSAAQVWGDFRAEEWGSGQ